jgi:hypothetical protein
MSEALTYCRQWDTFAQQQGGHRVPHGQRWKMIDLGILKQLAP